jgi:tripartite-type tricarboxylate transporter receptor subunit TctC
LKVITRHELYGQRGVGYTLELTVSGQLAFPFLMKLPFDVIADFTPVAMVGVASSVLCVAKSLPIRSIDELVEYARERPGALNYLNPGNGTPSHLILEQLKLEKKIDMASVPYKGLPPGVQDLLGERIQLGVISAPLVISHLKSGNLKAVGIAGGGRLAELPGVPTLAEQGYAGIQVQSALPLLGPAGLADPIVERLNTAFRKALADDRVRRRLAAAYIEPLPLTVAQTRDWVGREHERLGRTIVQLGIRPDGSN